MDSSNELVPSGILIDENCPLFFQSKIFMLNEFAELRRRTDEQPGAPKAETLVIPCK